MPSGNYPPTLIATGMSALCALSTLVLAIVAGSTGTRGFDLQGDADRDSDIRGPQPAHWSSTAGSPRHADQRVR